MSGCRLFYPVSIQQPATPFGQAGCTHPARDPQSAGQGLRGTEGRARPAAALGVWPSSSAADPTGNLVFSAAKRRVLQNIGEETLLSVAHMQPRDLQARADG